MSNSIKSQLITLAPNLYALPGNIWHMMTRQEWIVFACALAYTLCWFFATPIQFTADSNSYLGAAHLLLGQETEGMAPVFRAPGYPLFLLLTGAVEPGTFIITLLLQIILVCMVSVLVYRIIAPMGEKSAFVAAIISILSGAVIFHSNVIMTESVYASLLFIGLATAVGLIRNPSRHPHRIYWLAIIYVSLALIRPAGAPAFWPTILIIAISWAYTGNLKYYWKKLVCSVALFISLMLVWVAVDDVLFSVGTRYTPLVPITSPTGKLDTYLYELPFTEAYFDVWNRRINNVELDPMVYGSLSDRPAMQLVRNIVVKHIKKRQSELLSKESEHLHNIFGELAKDPEKLADRIFSRPHYAYANLVREAMTLNLSQQEKHALYYLAADEAGYTWPKRWIKKIVDNPLYPFLGVSRGSGMMRFMMAYTPLRTHTKIVGTGNIALIDPDNGPKSKLFYTILEETFEDNPDHWRGIPGLDKMVDQTYSMTDAIRQKPSQSLAWNMTVLLWGVMGFDNASDLLGIAADETLKKHYQGWILRSQQAMLNAAAGAANVTFVDGGLYFPSLTIYPYMETGELTEQQKQEVRWTKHKFEEPYLSYQQWFYWPNAIFYVLKPLFFFLSLVAAGILLARGHSIAIPLLLMIPHVLCIAVNGILVTTLQRYTDPTILLPMIITFMAIPELKNIWDERKQARKHK